MLSGTESLRRRRVHSEDALDSVRLKNSRSGYLSRVTTLCRTAEVLLNDSRNVNEVSKKLLEIEEAFSRFEKAHYDYVATLSGDLEEWECEARYFKEHFHRKMETVARIQQWIENAREITAPHTAEAPQENEDSVSTASSLRSSHLSVRQLKAKQALAELKLCQLKKKQALLRQEEETKLELEIVDAQYEIHRTDLQLKLLQDEEPAVLTNLRDVFQDLSPFAERGYAGAANVPKLEHSDPRVKRKIGSQNVQLPLNPNAQEFKSWPAGPTVPLAHPESTDPTLSGGIMDKMALTIKQGFALPKKELPVFDGDPLDYWNFIKSFENSIVNNAASESEKLMYLLQYTSGVAKETIKCCLVMDSSLGYRKARELLEERFGHPFTIASKYVSNLTQGPPLKPWDRTGLLAFADRLKDCEHTLQSIGYLEEINSADNLRRIVQRLPFHLRTKFVELADQIQQAGQRTNISHIAEFVKVKARAANNPVFGCVVDVGRDRSENPSRNQKRGASSAERLSTFNTRETKSGVESSLPSNKFAPTVKCPSCNGNHSLAKCNNFKDKNFDERLQVMRKAQLCFNCFKYGHISVGCLAKSACEIQGCRRKHHTLLHPPSSQKTVVGLDGVAHQEVQVEGNTPLQSGQANSTSTGGGKMCLRIVPVKVRSHNDASKFLETYALLDSGSDISLCDESLAMELGVQGSQKTFYLTTQEKQDSPRVGYDLSLTVEPLDGTDQVYVTRLWTVDKLNASSRSIPSEQDARQWPHLQGIKLPSISEKEVRLIIGTNVPDAFWVLEERRGNRGEPYAIRTPLGWTLMGPMERNDSEDCHLNVNFVRSSETLREDNDCLVRQLERFWDVENAGVIPESKLSMSVEDKRALAIMEQSVKLEDGHYQIALPWRQYPPFLPYNRFMAERRLQALKNRLLQDGELLENYKATMEQYLSMGHARRVPLDEISTQDKPLWYLPHHPVLNKPGKTRVVFDCAAKHKGTSLNEQLLTGPDLTNSIVGVLMRFREEQVALSADIECMFHQIRVAPDDRDAFRFLWWPNGDLTQQPIDHRMEVHLFGATSSPSCSSLALRRTAEDNISEFQEDVVNTVKRNFYVDDCLKSVRSVENAVEVVNQLREILSRGGFRLTKWSCNRSEVLDTIPQDEKAPSVLDLDLDKDKLPVQRTLGLHWDMESDKFIFKVALKDRPSTRRGILSLTSSVYDPLGFVAPVVLPAKKLLQDLCREKRGWDDSISDCDGERWEKWKSQLANLPLITVDRCVRPACFGDLKIAELHNFADASQIAYGAVTYLRLVDVEERIHCAFLIGKSRLAPLRPMTVPRLELSAAVLAVQLDRTVREELDIPINQSTFWSDSTCVLQYIRNQSKRFHTFVANRLSVIHENSAPHQWRHVSSELNPADEVTRGLTVDEMSASNKWLSGPEFLKKKEEFWPCDPTIRQPELSDDDLEIKREVQLYNQSSTSHASKDVLSRLIERYSSWDRLRRAVAWLLRFKTWFIEKYRGGSVNLRPQCCLERGPLLSVEEVKCAEREVIKHVQRLFFPDVIKAMQRISSSKPPRQVASELKSFKIPAYMRKLHPFLDDVGILRVGGRLENALIKYEAKHPIILPYRHQATDLIISQHHQETGHLGQEYVLSSLHQFYWIIKGRSAVRRVISSCFQCKKLGAVRGEQLMADLPKERLMSGDPPFTNVGVDYFGPFYVRQGRSNVKRYGCLFTCLVVRAVHIEVVNSLDTDSFINALRRFINLRGCPTTVYSDNGTNFQAGERELRELLSEWNQESIHKFLHQKNITWKFNPPAASHMGGAWERTIRSIRKILRALLGQQLVSDEMLRTLMSEVEGILNGRPLTPVSSDPKDLDPLTPNHLLLLRANPNLPPGVFNKEEMYSKRRWRQVQYMANIFWKRWLKEYLPTLQERTKWTKPRRCLATGDLVLIADDNIHRGKWPLARVTEVFVGKDENVRAAKVKTATTILTRPITKLCFLEGEMKA